MLRDEVESSYRDYFLLTDNPGMYGWYPGEKGPKGLTTEQVFVHRVVEEHNYINNIFPSLFSYCDFLQAHMLAQTATMVMERFDLITTPGMVQKYLLCLAYYKDFERIKEPVHENILSFAENQDLLLDDLTYYLILGQKEYILQHLETFRKDAEENAKERNSNAYHTAFMQEWGALEDLWDILFIDMILGNYDKVEQFLSRYLEMEETLIKKYPPFLPYTVRDYRHYFYPFLKWNQAIHSKNADNRNALAADAIYRSDKLVNFLMRKSETDFHAFQARLMGLFIRLEFDMEQDLVKDFLQHLGIFADIYPPASQKARLFNISFAPPPLDSDRIKDLLKNAVIKR